MTIRIPDLPALSGTPGGGSMLAYWSSTQDRTFKAGLTELTGYFYVKEYGAVGDGATDDAAAIQSAIDAADDAGGGFVVFEAKDYLLGTGLTMTGACIALQGQGWGTFTGYNAGTRLIYNGPDGGDWITISGDQCRVLDMELKCSFTPTGGRAIAMVKDVNAGSRHQIERVFIRDPYDGIDVYGFSFNIFRDVVISAFQGNYGIKFRGTATVTNFYSMIYNLTIDGNTTGACVLLEGNVASNEFLDCHFRDGAYGVRFILDTTASTTLRPGLMKFFRCEVETVEGPGFSIENGSFIDIIDCYVSINGLTTNGGPLSDGIFIGDNINSAIKICYCDIRANGRHGIRMVANANGGRVIISGCTISNNGVDSTNTYHGVMLEANCDGVLIENNLIGGNVWGDVGGSPLNQRYGVFVTAGCTNYTIAGNDLRGNNTGAVFDAGSDGQVYGNLGYKTATRGAELGVTPDGSGDVVITHGCDAVPQICTVELLGAVGTARATVQSFSSTTITARLFNTTTGAAITVGTFNVQWEAIATRATS